MNFQFIFNHAPQRIQDMFVELGRLRERPDFHPEESAAKHIEIVTTRCIASNNANLIMTGFFHDICKAQTARPNPKTGWPMCPGHDFEAEKLIRSNEEVQAMIRSFKADVDTVAWLVGQHMRIAQIDNMKQAKQDAFRAHPQFKLLEAFHCVDDMLVKDDVAIAEMFEHIIEYKRHLYSLGLEKN